MKKIILPILSSLGLVLVFVVVNILVNQIKPSNPEVFQVPDGFGRDKQTVGELGGAHYLSNSYIEPQQGFKRLVIETQLNRASVLEDTIATPYTSAEIVNGEIAGETIILKLADTTKIYEEEGRTEDIYSGINGIVTDQELPITQIEVLATTEEGEEIRIHTNKSIGGYRLHADPEKSGNIWLDILE